jgi:acyl dehydratase
MAKSIIDDIGSFYGEGERVSEWFVVEQALVDKFGEATCDSDWMHTDPARARQEGPFGGTIAFGFWTVSMMTYFARQTMGRDYPEGALYGLNYGFDRVRLMSPVPVGSRIRNRMRLIDVEDRGNGGYLVKTSNTIEVEGVEKPAMVAEWLFLLIYGAPAN